MLASLAFAKSRKRAELVTEVPWDLVIVDEAHHCKNRATQNWRLVNALKRRHLFLLTATPVQNNLLELYNLLTLLEPGHLKTETDFKRQYVRRGNPRDPRNRERLRSLLGEVMVRNTRSLVQIDLPPRYAQTILAAAAGRRGLLVPATGSLLAAAAGPVGRWAARIRRKPGVTTRAERTRRRRWSLESPRQAGPANAGRGATRSGSSGSRPAGGTYGLPGNADRWGERSRARCCWPRAVTPGHWRSRWKTSPPATGRPNL